MASGAFRRWSRPIISKERLPEWAADILFPPLRSILVLPGEAVRAIEVAGRLCLLLEVYPKAVLVYGSHQGAAIFQGLDAKRLDCAGSCSERESINLYFDSDAQKKGLPFNRCLDGQNYYGPVRYIHDFSQIFSALLTVHRLQGNGGTGAVPVNDVHLEGLPFNRCLDGQNYYGPVLINGMHEEARSLTDLEMISANSGSRYTPGDSDSCL